MPEDLLTDEDMGIMAVMPQASPPVAATPAPLLSDAEMGITAPQSSPWEANAARIQRRYPTREPHPLATAASQGKALTWADLAQPLLLPGQVAQGALASQPETPNVLTEEDVFRQDVARQKEIEVAAGLGLAMVGTPAVPGGALGSSMRFKRLAGPMESDPGYVYHATNADRALEIVESGKLQRYKPHEFTDQDVWPDGSVERRNYFTPTAENTWQFAPEEGQGVLLRVPREAHEFKTEGTGDLYSTKDVPASKIEALTENGWAPLAKESSTPEPLAPPFYSAVERAINEVPQEKAAGGQWLGMIRNKPGVKPEEMQWLGLEDWLKGRQGPVSKQEIGDYVRANQIEVREVGKGNVKYTDPSTAYLADFDPVVKNINGPADIADARRFNANFRETFKAVSDEQLLKNIEEYKANPPMGSTKFGPDRAPTLTLPGGENYRELLLTLPPAKDTNAGAFKEYLRKVGIDPETWRGDQNSAVWIGFKKQQGENFRSSHWDEPNVLAHVRFNDRVVDGKKTLFLEELQSDWHQAGKRKGYKEPGQFESLDKQLEDARSDLSKLIDQIRTEHGLPSASEAIAQRLPIEERAALVERRQQLYDADPRYNALIQETQRLESERAKAAGTVPDAPFKTTWPELSLKRMIRYAAENGYEKIAWTPGEVQAARYDLSKQISRIEYDRIPTFENQEPRWVVNAYDHQGNGVMKKSASASELPDIIGKDIADKIVGSKEKQGELSGLDLKVGGEGMKGFYDDILPKAANKIVKKFGAKTEPGIVETNKAGWHIAPPNATFTGKWMVKSSDYNSKGLHFDTEAEAKAALKDRLKKEPIHTLTITPELRKSVLTQGFPQFASGGRVSANNIDTSPSEAQKEAGNYAKDHVRVHGLDITIENAKGSKRTGIDKGGKPWLVTMPAHYGYIKGTVGKDKDHVDVYLGPHMKAPHVFVIDQMNAETKKFDEHKAFMGFASKAQVVNTYRKAFSDGRAGERLGHIAMLTVDEFKRWLTQGNTARMLKHQLENS